MSAYEIAAAVLAYLCIVALVIGCVHAATSKPMPKQPQAVDDVDAATPELDDMADDLVARMLPGLLAADAERSQHVADALAKCDVDYLRLAGE